MPTKIEYEFLPNIVRGVNSFICEVESVFSIQSRLQQDKYMQYQVSEGYCTR